MAAFPLFCSFPPEIHSLIISSCPSNDRTCLGLTCKYLYSLSSLKAPISLSDMDEPTHLCGWTTSPPPKGLWYQSHLHRNKCHEQCYEELTRRNEKLGLPSPKWKKCRTKRRAHHCQCFLRKPVLYQRLQSWMPKRLKYCEDCKKFTRRKAQGNDRCYHGSQKPPSRQKSFWTFRPKKGAFGRKLWKKWFNNAAMNSLEERLSWTGGWNRSNKRYDLRSIPPRQICTREIRGAQEIPLLQTEFNKVNAFMGD